MNTTNHTSPSGEDAANGAIGEREAFEAEWKRAGWGDADTKKQCFHFWQARAALTAEKVAAEPVGYVNGDELDNMLDDRTATIQASPNGWRKTPLYRSPQQPAQSAEQDESGAFEAALRRGVFDVDRVSDFHNCETEAAWRGWQARAASTSANVAQGAEAKLEFMPVDSMQHAIVHGSTEAIAALKARMERDYRVASLVPARPAQTALTAAARDAARYPHAAIGAALISTGLYDRMNDITSGDREARHLIEELISKVDPILDRWHNAALTAAQSASGGERE